MQRIITLIGIAWILKVLFTNVLSEIVFFLA
jgi:hypothetical protein